MSLRKALKITQEQHFLVKCYLVFWEEENSVSVVPASSIVEREQAMVGERCDVLILRKRYPAKIAATGQYMYSPSQYIHVALCLL